MVKKSDATADFRFLKGVNSGDLPTIYANMLAVVTTDTEVILLPCDHVPDLSDGKLEGELQTRPLGFIRMSPQTALSLVDSVTEGLRKHGITKG